MHQPNADDSTPEQLNQLLRAAELTAISELRELTEEERRELDAFMAANPAHTHWHTTITAPEQRQQLLDAYDRFAATAPERLAQLQQQRHKKTPVVPFIQRRWWWAAAVAAGVACGAYLLLQQQPQQAQQPQPTTAAADLPPGHEGAVLTLSDGRQVVLDSIGNGVVATQNGATVVLREKRITYQATGTADTAVTYNTITTPRGRQYNIVLPDGSRVWLNAASQLRYPTAFNGKERKVELLGEAYFEIADNSRMPFLVTAQGNTVTVLGTHFNIKAYADEQNMVTSLLQGAVKLDNGKQQAILKPGQMGQISKQEEQITTTSAEVADAVAWKNGYFVFRNEPVRSMMKQVARWYDVEVEYQGDPGAVAFGGTFSRAKTLAQLLSNLELTKTIHFKIEGKKVIVLP